MANRSQAQGVPVPTILANRTNVSAQQQQQQQQQQQPQRHVHPTHHLSPNFASAVPRHGSLPNVNAAMGMQVNIGGHRST